MTTPIVDQIFGNNKAPLAEVLPADFADLIADVEAKCASAASLPTTLKSDYDLGKIGTAIRDMRDVGRRVEAERTLEGKPLLDAKRELDGFFKSLGDKLEKAVKPLQDAADEYTKRKAAEERARLEREAFAAREREDAERRKAEAAKTDEGARNAEGRAEGFAARADRLEVEAGASVAELTRTRVDGVTASAVTKFDFRVTDYDAIPLEKLRPYLARAAVETAIRSYQRVHKGAAAMAGVEFFEDVKSTFRR